MKKLLFILLFVLSLFGHSFAFTGNDCQILKKSFIIEGNDIIKIGVSAKFKLNKNLNNITWNILKNGNVVNTLSTKKLNYTFKTRGDMAIQAVFKEGNCDIIINKKLKVYKQIVLLFSKEKLKFIPYRQLEEQSILLNQIGIDEKSNLVKNADFILISQNNIIKFFSDTTMKLGKDTKYILYVNSFKGFYSKFIIPYVKKVSKNNIYIYNKTDFLNILETIYKGEQLDKSKLFIVSSIGDKIYFPLSYFINKLISYGISIDMIGLVLLALFGIIVIAIFRQIIGFSVFGVYTPLLFVILTNVIGYSITLLLFILSIFSNIFTYIITRKIYILYSSKIALNYIIYVILSIIIIGIFIKYHFIKFGTINNTVILGFFIMPLLSKNLIKEETSIFSKTFWLFVLEFIFISFILMLVFSLNTLKYMLVAYPDLLWIFVIFTILIGRFSGLQILEYIRFYPLIKKGIYEEE